MKNLKLLLLLIPFISYSQEILPPQVNLESGFYTEENLNVILTHENPELQILYTTDGSVPKIENLEGKSWNYKTHYPYLPGIPYGELLSAEMKTYIYNSPVPVYDRTSDETVLGSINPSIFHNDPYVDGELYKAFVLRVCAYDENTGEYSEVITRNYFMTEQGTERYSIPIIALSMDNDLMYSYESGLNVPGVLFDDWRAANPNKGFDGTADANFRAKGSDSEFEIHFSYYEDGEEILNHNAGLRLNGSYTRIYPNRSLRLYAKSGYGAKNFKHEFFEDYPYNKFKRLILRNSGNDGVASFFRDAFIHKLSENLHSDIQQSRPVVVFINGEYNGLRNLRERYDKKYFSMKYNVDEDEIDFLDYFIPEPEVKEGDLVFFNEMINYFMYNSLEDNTKFEEATTFLDPVNYTDYFITYVYSANVDWVGNNVLLWRNKIEFDPSEPGPEDGRFRWIIKDMDMGFHLFQEEGNAYWSNLLHWTTGLIDYDADPYTNLSNQQTLLIRRLLENEEYKTYFINRFADVLNTTYKEDRVVNMIDDFADIYRPEILENSRRWHNFTIIPQYWEDEVDRMKDFALNRPEHQRLHIEEKFDLHGQFQLNIDVSNPEHGFVHLNSIAITPETDGIGEDAYPWAGIYFKNVPIELTAVPAEGYEFVKWTGDVHGTNAQITISPDENLSITAVFEEDLGTDDVESEPLFTVYPNPVSDKLRIHNGTSYFGAKYGVYDTAGRLVKNGKYNGYGINVLKLSPGVYFVTFEKEGERYVRKFIKTAH